MTRLLSNVRDDLAITLNEIADGNSSSIVAQMLEWQQSAHLDNSRETWATHLKFLEIALN